MSLKYAFLLAFLCAWVHRGSAVELTVNCNEHEYMKNYCVIEPIEQIKLQLNDTLKFTVGVDTIKGLNIKNLKLVALPSGIFRTFPAMEDLSVTGLGISILLADRFEGADKLKFLHISNNNITIVPSKVFVNLPNVEQIELSNNKVKIIEDDAFDGLMNLKMLSIAENLIKSIGRSAFTVAPKIKYLNLGYNKIERIEDGAFNLPNLEHLDLSHNQMTTLSDGLLVGAINLHSVLFNHNKITHIGEAFNDCNKLEKLDLSENPAENVELPSLAMLKNVKYLYLKNIGLKLPEEIPSPTPNKSKLEHIWLNSNNLSNPDILKHLSVFGQLEDIHLAKNRFPTINDVDKIRKYFPALRRLNLDYNEPSLCDWIRNNEQFLEHMWVLSSTSEGDVCRSAASGDTTWRPLKQGY